MESNMEDKKIIDLFLKRDETAISETSNKYGMYCKTIANNITKNEQDTQECVNDTYFKAWNSIPPQIPNILSAYLGRITRNLAITRYRYNKMAKRGGDDITLVFDELDECIPSYSTVEKEYEAGITAKAISNFLENLDKESRMVFVRRYWYADSISQLTEEFNMSESKVKSLLFRLRNKLKDYLEKEEIIL